MVRIPVGRVVRWAQDMKHGYSRGDGVAETHDFRNAGGAGLEESKEFGGLKGDPWCVVCGKVRKLHRS